MAHTQRMALRRFKETQAEQFFSGADWWQQEEKLLQQQYEETELRGFEWQTKQEQQ